jgi:uncharacterized protein YerC
MTRVSRYKLKDEVLDKLFYLFFEIVGKKNDINEFKNIISDLLSPTERIMIAKRITIIYLLLKNIDYLTIVDVIKVSPSTIAKFHLLMEKSTGIVPAFNKIIKNEKIVEFLEELYLDLRGPGKYGVNWSAAWQNKIDFERRKRRGI